MGKRGRKQRKQESKVEKEIAKEHGDGVKGVKWRVEE